MFKDHLAYEVQMVIVVIEEIVVNQVIWYEFKFFIDIKKSTTFFFH